MKRSCGTCEFFGEFGVREPSLPNLEGGQCRRSPPSIKNGRGFWPIVGSDDWCGEWKPKPEKSEKMDWMKRKADEELEEFIF